MKGQNLRLIVNSSPTVEVGEFHVICYWLFIICIFYKQQRTRQLIGGLKHTPLSCKEGVLRHFQ